MPSNSTHLHNASVYQACSRMSELLQAGKQCLIQQLYIVCERTIAVRVTCTILSIKQWVLCTGRGGSEGW